ncbi:MAG TPA: hypothetical protein VH062_02275 [Polyangiaceae bacterium]|jgi:hypothetical protein|nr:hypothetical protein [Polyangiaceae bacterium]
MLDRELKAFNARIRKQAFDVAFGDITAAAMTKFLDFASALPADASIVGVDANATTAFTDGASGTLKVDLGFSGATTTLMVGGANNLGTINRVGNGAADGCPQFAGGKTPRASFTSNVNLSTLTAGQCRIHVYYVLLDQVSREDRG